MGVHGGLKGILNGLVRMTRGEFDKVNGTFLYSSSKLQGERWWGRHWRSNTVNRSDGIIKDNQESLKEG